MVPKVEAFLAVLYVGGKVCAYNILNLSVFQTIWHRGNSWVRLAVSATALFRGDSSAVSIKYRLYSFLRSRTIHQWEWLWWYARDGTRRNKLGAWQKTGAVTGVEEASSCLAGATATNRGLPQEFDEVSKGTVFRITS